MNQGLGWGKPVFEVHRKTNHGKSRVQKEGEKRSGNRGSERGRIRKKFETRGNSRVTSAETVRLLEGTRGKIKELSSKGK